MFDNLLYQNASNLLENDIKNGKLPGSILLSGPAASGKLTCALELARVLSCTGDGKHPKGHWLCECQACRKSKELTNANVLIAGPRDCILEIYAAKKAFLNAAYNNSRSLAATRYLFLRAVRKLTNRFSQILWEDDDKVPKIAQIMQPIDDDMEKISPDKELLENEKLEKTVNDIVVLCEKLESSFMYESIPISQIRNAAAWARLKSAEGKKVFIIENVERMLEGSRNALLKILEEPPEDAVFILTTSRRQAVMQTILSRVRTYTFSERTQKQQDEVIDRVFHAPNDKKLSIAEYLETFLPVNPEEIKKAAGEYFKSIMEGHIVLSSTIAKQCNGFSPTALLKSFLIGIMEAARKNPQDAENARFCEEVVAFTRNCYNNVTVYNQSPAAAVEILARDLASARRFWR